MFTLASRCHVVHSRDVRSLDFSRPLARSYTIAYAHTQTIAAR